jgi:hypothetical protein
MPLTLAALIEQWRDQADGASSAEYAAGLNSAAEDLASWLTANEEWPTVYPA